MKLKITAVFNYWSMYHNVKWRLVLAVVTLIDHVKRTGREKKTERTWPRCPRWLLQACLVGWISLQTVEEVSTLHCTQTQRKIHITSTVPIDHGGDCFCNKSLWQMGGKRKKKEKRTICALVLPLGRPSAPMAASIIQCVRDVEGPEQ